MKTCIGRVFWNFFCVLLVPGTIVGGVGLPKRYSVEMLLTIASNAFDPPVIVTTGLLSVDSVSRRSTFVYPAYGVTQQGVSHRDVVYWDGAEATDFFWQFNASGVIEDSCSSGPFGDGSNRTPFYTLSSLLPKAVPAPARRIRYADCQCFFTQIRNTTQCFYEGNAWFVESYWNGEQQWAFGETVSVDNFPAGTFDLPSCFVSGKIRSKLQN